MVSYIFYDINGHFVKIAAIQTDGGISLSKNQSHSSSYSRISFKKEENGSEKRIDKTLLPLPGCQFFQIHGSKLKLHPVRHLSQASVLCITHSVFFFGVCKDAFNGLFTPPVKALVLLISEDKSPRIFFYYRRLASFISIFSNSDIILLSEARTMLLPYIFVYASILRLASAE